MSYVGVYTFFSLLYIDGKGYVSHACKWALSKGNLAENPQKGRRVAIVVIS
jgi:hypothetical protein